MTEINQKAIEEANTARLHLECGEWIARRLLENRELIHDIPPILYSYYQFWLVICAAERDNKLYEEKFRKKLI